MTDELLKQSAIQPQAVVEVRGKSSALLKAAGCFAAGIAASAALMGPGYVKISDAISQMHVRGEQAGLQQTDTGARPQAQLTVAATPATGPTLSDTDRARVQVLGRPVPSDTRAAAEIARAIPKPIDKDIQMPSAEQTQVLSYGVFAPIVSRVYSNVTKQKETHWALHPWDVARLADQAAAELYKEKHIRVDPRLIAGAYYTESGGVVQVGFDRKGVDLLNKGKSIDQVVKSGSKASFGLFQIDQQHEGARDADPLKGAKRAGEFLAEGQDNLRQYPKLGMLAVSATYNASSKLRAKIFAGAPMDDRELEALDGVRRHAASMSYGAAIYDLAHRTYQQHLTQAHRQGLPVAVAADQVKRVDPLKGERVGAVYALTGRQFGEQAPPVEQPVAAVAPLTPVALVATQQSAPARQVPQPAQIAVPSVPGTSSLAQSLRMAPAASPKLVATAPAAAPAPAAHAHAKPVAGKPTTGRPGQARQSASEFVGGRMNGANFGAIGAGRAAVAQRAENILPPAQRVRSAFVATTNDWRTSSSGLLDRVVSFHQQRTREMATQQAQRDGP